MRLLVLGGTEFVGRAAVAEAGRRGWDVTAFHRGTRPAPTGVTVLHGDRTAEGGLDALAQGTWDLVLDTWSGAPSAVRDAATLLAGRARHYTYVSSRSVYAWPTAAGSGEDAPLVAGSPDAAATEYAADKRGGELAAEAAFGPGRTLLVRAGLILGPWENVGRLPWWLNRMARGGRVLAPGPRELPIQYVDARDLAAWALDAAERGLAGPYNLVSRPGHATMGELLETCAELTGSGAELCWTPPERVLAAQIAPWTELPVWTPPGEAHDALHRSGTGKALAAGLVCRPVRETVADTWAWLRGLPEAPGERPGLGLAPEKEARALAG
ncbi:NAD-dependent epimerase/dehydratase family protein [Streptomyces hoynatensis]|uniref:NAD-dependent epimerase/dehydratase family protein n=1 Tax=Streptomyces hoynatensis TaxID=1141874 RepID=A0A3A9YS47_9ACTN|nr:NAD-dependent epimerase/dehydratase family protein [Streptomyces hoynatensis]RKN38314.1 NAD-dependent epimerase/dehydratase family protein [Streptomyces hoynatensis]